MRVLYDKCKKGNQVRTETSYKFECEHCGSELEAKPADISYGFCGLPKVTCPCCGKETYIDESICSGIRINADNLSFPDHYYHFGGKDSYKISDKEINEWVSEMIATMRHEKSESLYRACGDSWVTVIRLDGDEGYEVIVAKNYYDAFVSFEPADYT